MNHIQIKKTAILVALVALMAFTRMHHFGTGLHLPDASLAVFLLAGAVMASPLFFAILVFAVLLLLVFGEGLLNTRQIVGMMTGVDTEHLGLGN